MEKNLSNSEQGDNPSSFNAKVISILRSFTITQSFSLYISSFRPNQLLFATVIFIMATDASPQYRPMPPPPDFHPEISLFQSPTHDGLNFWQFMIAGSIAGSVKHMAMFPVDTLKTRMQALGALFSVQPVGVRQALGFILKLEGPSGLYPGRAAMGLGAGPAHAVYFSVYELSKQILSHGEPNNSMAHAASGVVATVTSDAVFTPMDMVKQRLQLNSSPYKGVQIVYGGL